MIIQGKELNLSKNNELCGILISLCSSAHPQVHRNPEKQPQPSLAVQEVGVPREGSLLDMKDFTCKAVIIELTQSSLVQKVFSPQENQDQPETVVEHNS